MSKIAVISCSNAGLDYIDHPYDIKTFRSSLHLGEETFLDSIEISTDEFYRRLEQDKSIFPRSSYYPIGKMVEMYEDLVEKGFDTVIVVTISKQMSGIFNAALMASNEVDKLEVKVFDSKTVAYAQALMALKAAEMAKTNATVEEILTELLYIRDNNKINFAVNTLTYLVKNGRIGKASGFIGNAMKIKPILTINDGVVDTVDKVRTFKKAIDRLLEIYFKETKGKEVVPYIVQANNPEMTDYIRNQIIRNQPKVTEVISLPLTAVVGAHAGPKTIGLGYFIKK